MARWLPVLLLAAAIAAVRHAADAYTNPIVVHHYKMYDAKTGAYFGVRGVNFYPRPNDGALDQDNLDLFSDELVDVWSPHLPFLAAAGANAVRLHAVDPTKSHDKFMCALRSYGIYALIDIGWSASSCDGCAITGEKAPACYPKSLKTHGEKVITAFAKYDNVLAFSAGNEPNALVHDSTVNAPCQKKFLRDMRAFVASCATRFRQIPVGVVVADEGLNLRAPNIYYYTCRTNTSDVLENAEWYGTNSFCDCDGTAKVIANMAGFRDILPDLKRYNIPVPILITAFGCVDKTYPTIDGFEAQRLWLQAGWLQGLNYREAFNGGFISAYSTEANKTRNSSAWPFKQFAVTNNGLGYLTPEQCDGNATRCEFVPFPNYKNLAEQYNASDYAAEASMSALKLNANRLVTPACPSGYASLSSIDWSTVNAVESLACPAKAIFTCPDQVSSGDWTVNDTTNTSSAATPDRSKRSFSTLMAAAVVTTVIAAFLG